MTSCTIEPMAAYPAFVNTIADLAAPSCRIRTLSTSHLKTALSKIHVVVFCRPALEDGHRQGAGRAVHGDGQLRRRIVTNIEHAFKPYVLIFRRVFLLTGQPGGCVHGHHHGAGGTLHGDGHARRRRRSAVTVGSTLRRAALRRRRHRPAGRTGGLCAHLVCIAPANSLEDALEHWAETQPLSGCCPCQAAAAPFCVAAHRKPVQASVTATGSQYRLVLVA